MELLFSTVFSKYSSLCLWTLICSLLLLTLCINFLNLVEAASNRLKQVNMTYVSLMFLSTFPESQSLAKSYLSSFQRIPVALQVIFQLWLKHLAANPLCQFNRRCYCHFRLTSIVSTGGYHQFAGHGCTICSGNGSHPHQMLGSIVALLNRQQFRFHWILCSSWGLLLLAWHFLMEDLRSTFFLSFTLMLLNTVSSCLHNFRKIIFCFYLLSSSFNSFIQNHPCSSVVCKTEFSYCSFLSPSCEWANR